MPATAIAKAKEQIEVGFENLTGFVVTVNNAAAFDLLLSLAEALGPGLAIKAIVQAVEEGRVKGKG